MIVRISLIILLISCMKDKSPQSDDPSPNGSSVVVSDVNVSGEEGAYTFKVTLKSPDLGCNQYADWWEVISEKGELIYRRNLSHSHVNEQPFTRSGGPVPISKDENVFIRGHMNTNGYGLSGYFGNVTSGFLSYDLENDFATELETQQPLPPDCQF